MRSKCAKMTPVATLVDLLDATELRLRAVHLVDAPPPLHWVATSELTDPTPYLEGGELLLTTGLETKGWRREWHAYVERLVAVGVAGLALGTGLTHQASSKSLVDACRRHGLSLLEVPRKTPFVAVSREAAALLQHEEAAAAKVALELQRELTRSARGLDPRALLERLAILVDGAAAVLSRTGAVVDGPYGPHAHALDLEAAAAEVHRIRGGGLRASSAVSTPAGTTAVSPIGLQNGPRRSSWRLSRPGWTNPGAPRSRRPPHS